MTSPFHIDLVAHVTCEINKRSCKARKKVDDLASPPSPHLQVVPSTKQRSSACFLVGCHMAAAHAASFNPTCNAVSSISVQASGRQITRSSFTPRLPFSSRGLSLKKSPALRTHPWKPPIIALAQGNHVKKVTAKELDTILDGTRDCPVVVDFYATWCGPCVLLSQELELLAAEYGETVKFLKVDTDEEFELASEMKIQGLPTLIFVSKDTEKNAIRTEGLLPADVIRNIIENEL